MTAGRRRLLLKQLRRQQRPRSRSIPPGLLNKGRARIPTTVPLREPPGFTFGDSSGVGTGRLPRKDLGDVGIDALGSEASGLSKEALEEGGASLLAGSGIAGSVASFESAAASLSAAAPVGVVLADVGGIALGLYDAFGGDFSLQGYATTPQLDATTAEGQAASRAQARLIRQSLAAGGTKFGFKGQADPTLGLM